MDLIKISDTKIKIMLSSSDMSYYDLHNDSISLADAHARRVLGRLLADARDLTGFDSDMSRLYIQMFPCADGGCELFISKSDQSDSSLSLVPMQAKSDALPRASHACLPDKRYTESAVYVFSTFDCLVRACKRLRACHYIGKSSLYAGQQKSYYLLLEDLPLPSLRAPDEFFFLNEYGTRVNIKTVQALLGEYVRLICEHNAIQTISAL